MAEIRRHQSIFQQRKFSLLFPAVGLPSLWNEKERPRKPRHVSQVPQYIRFASESPRKGIRQRPPAGIRESTDRKPYLAHSERRENPWDGSPGADGRAKIRIIEWEE
jgi:hypothetical protein